VYLYYANKHIILSFFVTDILQAMVILHGRLQYMKIDNVGITKLEITGYNIQTLSGKLM